MHTVCGWIWVSAPAVCVSFCVLQSRLTQIFHCRCCAQKKQITCIFPFTNKCTPFWCEHKTSKQFRQFSEGLDFLGKQEGSCRSVSTAVTMDTLEDFFYFCFASHRGDLLKACMCVFCLCNFIANRVLQPAQRRTIISEWWTSRGAYCLLILGRVVPPFGSWNISALMPPASSLIRRCPQRPAVCSLDTTELNDTFDTITEAGRKECFLFDLKNISVSAANCFFKWTLSL